MRFANEKIILYRLPGWCLPDLWHGKKSPYWSDPSFGFIIGLVVHITRLLVDFYRRHLQMSFQGLLEYVIQWLFWQPKALSNFFLKFIIGGHKSFLWSHWYPCFGPLVTFPWGSKPGSTCLCAFSLAYSGFLRFTSGMTPADLLAASMGAKPFPSMYLQIMYPQALVGIKPTTYREVRSTALLTIRPLRLGSNSCFMNTSDWKSVFNFTPGDVFYLKLQSQSLSRVFETRNESFQDKIPCIFPVFPPFLCFYH